MNMAGEQRIAASRQRVWEALNNPEILRASIPGCQNLEKAASDRFTATVEVKVGPIGARFKSVVTLTDLNAPAGYTLNMEGNGGIAGSVKGSAKVRLREEGTTTVVAYDVDAQVGGRMAQLGGPIIDASTKQLANKFFTRFGEIVGGEKSRGAASTEAHAQASTTATMPRAGSPVAWVLATVVAVLTGYLIGRGQGGTGSDWMGVAIGLLLIVVAGAAFEYGRRAAPVVKLDAALLRRLLHEDKE